MFGDNFNLTRPIMLKKLQLLFLALTIGSFGAISGSANVTGNLYSGPNISAGQILFKDEFDELIKSALELYKQKKYDEALAKCVEAGALNPKDFRPHSISGLIYMAQWKMKSASEAFARAIELNPTHKFLYLYKAKSDRMRNEWDLAVAASRKAIELDPDFAEAYLIIAEVLQNNEKRRDEAEQAFRSALKADPNSLNALVEFGRFLSFYKEDKKGAEEHFRKAMQLDPKKMTGRFELGRMMVEQNRLKEAREMWDGRTTDEDRTFPNFIVVLERAERLQKATDALAKKPDDPETLVEMGNAVMEGDSWRVDGRQEKAIVYFRKALKIKPGFTAAQYAIVKAYIQIADISKDKNKIVDEELAKLKKMDAKLAAEMEEYRKTYSGGLKTSGTTLNQ